MKQRYSSGVRIGTYLRYLTQERASRKFRGIEKLEAERPGRHSRLLILVVERSGNDLLQ